MDIHRLLLVIHFSMKATNSLLLQYEHTLKAELENTKASYNHDMWVQLALALNYNWYFIVCNNKQSWLFFICNPTRKVYEERISSYRNIFQSHKDYYCQNPVAQKLLMLQAEKEELEFRIKACDSQITMKQMELENLTGNKLFISS